MAKLTDKQQLFVLHYCQCWNASEAARRAGYPAKNADVIGHQNLVKLGIQEAVKKRIAATAMTSDEVLFRLAQQARAEQSQFFTSDGRGGIVVDTDKMLEAGLGHLIKAVTRDARTGRVTKVEFHDAQAALALLGKHHKLFTEKSEISGPNGGAIQHEHSGNITFEHALAMPIGELQDAIRDALN